MFKVALLSAWHVHAEEYLVALDKSEGASIDVVWDNDEKRGKALADKYNKPFESDFNSVISREDIDGVIVCTATNMHKEVIIAAAEAKKHIFTEKVLAATMDEANEIKEAVERNGIKFCISFPHRTFGGNLFAKKAIEDKLIGDVTFIRIRNAHNGAVGNWLPSRFYDAKEACGGAMLDLGAHPMYLIRWFLGRPKSVVSMFTDYTGHGVEDNAVSVLEYENGVTAVSETGFITSHSPYSVEIYGTQGTVLVGGTDDKTRIRTKDNDEKGFVVVEELTAGTSAMKQWVEAVKGNDNIEFNIEQAIELTEMMENAYRSHREGKKILF